MSAYKRVETLHIPEARFVREDGSTQLVQPVLADEQYLRPGRIPYDREQHHMKLLCPYCDVRVDFNRGSGAAICGTQITGTRAHFRKAPGQEHGVQCKLPATGDDESNSEIDPRAPYRIHLNMLMGGAAGNQPPVYGRAKGGKVITFDERLQPQKAIVPVKDGQGRIVKRYKKTVSVRDVQDIIGLMKKGEFDRLKNSLVIHNTVVQWTDFAILNAQRLRALVDRLLRGASHPIMLHFGLEKPVRGLYAEGNKILYKQEGENDWPIVPRIYMDGPDTKDVFNAKGAYLVMGMPRVHFNKRSGVYFLNISLKSSGQVAAYSPAALLAEARERAQMRQESKAPSP
ncbi:MAG: hypothetical protein HYS17_04465 [Micavibrio aeruginosavorus]|uniref:Uncharacterized protein n=1 Tax=Micavibrio aeruginosavorus TaxID=349221 RepID=A0A7T5UIT4_9BACT|nr:MAG: hypothetical protein HYS17_04465 [Micavibrio aeruginosavorus]